LTRSVAQHCGLLVCCIGEHNRRAYIILLLSAMLAVGTQCLHVAQFQLTSAIPSAVRDVRALAADATHADQYLHAAWPLLAEAVSAITNILILVVGAGVPAAFGLQQLAYCAYARGLVLPGEAPRVLRAAGLRDWGALPSEYDPEDVQEDAGGRTAAAPLLVR
jgi:hypothetical protein